jgi:N-acetylglutamate synthase-like GNAT family acetyltransferase
VADNVVSVLFRFKGIRFVAAAPESYPRLSRFLAEQELPIEDLGPETLAGFELAIDRHDRLVGMAGIEVFGDDALLRWVAVAHGWRRKGIGRCLVARREDAARDLGAKAIYVLADSVRDFFGRIGYESWAREAVPAAVAGHLQFRVFRPSGAECFRKPL